MAISHILLAFLLALPLLLTFLAARSSKKCPEYNGPTIYPIIGNIFEFFINRHRFLEWATDAASRIPSNTFRIQRPGVSGFYTCNPANVEHILRTHFDNYPKGQRFTYLLHDFLGRGIFNVDGELWKMQRKAASYEFKTNSLRNFVVETVQWEIRNRLMPLLCNAAQIGDCIDLQNVFHGFAFDNICRVAFGVDPLHLRPSLSLAQAFDDATHISSGRFFYTLPHLWKLKRFFNVGSEKRLREAILVVDEFVMGIIRSRRSENEEGRVREDLLSRFMAAVMANPELVIAGCDGEGTMADKTDVFLRDMVVSFMMAGRDTTSTALTWFFWLLSSRPSVEEAIRLEISQVLKARKEEEEEEIVLFSFEELKSMHYLQAALSESMRLCPPVPVDTKIAASDDVLPDGNVVRKGCFVSYGIYSMGRMESIWGSDCLEFKPERWLRNGEFVGENSYRYPVFQAGPRICLGKEMSFIQMKSIAASIIHRFSVTVKTEYVPKYTISITLRMKGGLPVVISRR
uniref:CYP94D82 n=1 Tax=Taxus chinensis TaxID=29808 RepID=A0A291FAZ7_TAXCH|nr:CYP94D82 [Taxus chinensis]